MVRNPPFTNSILMRSVPSKDPLYEYALTRNSEWGANETNPPSVKRNCTRASSLITESPASTNVPLMSSCFCPELVIRKAVPKANSTVAATSAYSGVVAIMRTKNSRDRTGVTGCDFMTPPWDRDVIVRYRRLLAPYFYFQVSGLQSLCQIHNKEEARNAAVI